MIFVPLNDGRVQAFHAGTLESLWVYTDTVGGNASTALRYDSGYLYAGFADGNLVCLSVTDEDPDRTDEQKSAVWRKYDSGGYYRTGVYTGEKCLYACGRSGSVYCLDKRTGETLQSLSLPSEAGAASTGRLPGRGQNLLCHGKRLALFLSLRGGRKAGRGRGRGSGPGRHRLWDAPGL